MTPSWCQQHVIKDIRQEKSKTASEQHLLVNSQSKRGISIESNLQNNPQLLNETKII